MPAPSSSRVILASAVGAVFLLGGLVLSGVVSAPWAIAPKPTLTVLKRTPREAPLDVSMPTPLGMPSDEDEKGRRYQIPVTSSQASIGPEHALVTIVNWCDFSSKICRHSDGVMKQIMTEYQGRVRWVFRHLPTTAEAVSAHYLAYAVSYQFGKFWNIRARLLEQPEGKVLSRKDLATITKDVGLDWEALSGSMERFGGFVGTDIRFADQFGVERPHGIFVNGRRLPRATKDLLHGIRRLINEELAVAKRMVAAGVPKDKLYAEIIKDGYWGVNDDPKAREAAQAAAAQAGGQQATASKQVTAAAEPK